MILGTSVASSKGTTMMATLLMELAARCHCRGDPLMPHLLRITLSGRSCSCWSVLRESRNSTAHGLPGRSDSLNSHMHRPSLIRKTRTQWGNEDNDCE